jgi:hypothetical protein
MNRSLLALGTVLFLAGCTTIPPTQSPGGSTPASSVAPAPSSSPVGLSIDCGPLTSDQPACTDAVALAVHRVRPDLGPIIAVRIVAWSPSVTCLPGQRCPYQFAARPDITVILVTSGGRIPVALMRQPTGGWTVSRV